MIEEEDDDNLTSHQRNIAVENWININDPELKIT